MGWCICASFLLLCSWCYWDSNTWWQFQWLMKFWATFFFLLIVLTQTIICCFFLVRRVSQCAQAQQRVQQKLVFEWAHTSIIPNGEALAFSLSAFLSLLTYTNLSAESNKLQHISGSPWILRLMTHSSTGGFEGEFRPNKPWTAKCSQWRAGHNFLTIRYHFSHLSFYNACELSSFTAVCVQKHSNIEDFEFAL